MPINIYLTITELQLQFFILQELILIVFLRGWYGEYGTVTAKCECQANNKRSGVFALRKALDRAVLPRSTLTGNLWCKAWAEEKRIAQLTKKTKQNADAWTQFCPALLKIEKEG